MKLPLQIILIAGGTCSGKSEFTKWFNNAVVISQDDFYFGKSRMTPNENGTYNFDVPEAIDIEECASAVKELTEKGTTTIPDYDMLTSARIGTKTLTLSENIRYIVVEGIFSFYSPLLELASMRIFIDTPVEVRVARRLTRDISRTGLSKIQTMQNLIHIEENYEKYIEPTKKYADLVIPYSTDMIKFKY